MTGDAGAEFDEMEHAKILGKLKNSWSHKEASDTDDPPVLYYVNEAKTLWGDVGKQADELATYLKKALNRLLDKNDGGWVGEAADTFGDTVDNVVKFTREIAHAADSQYDAGSTNENANDSNFQNSTKQGSFVQTLETLYNEIDAAQKDENSPAPPYWEDSYWVKWWWAGYEIRYEIRKGKGEGTIVDPPGHSGHWNDDEFAGGGTSWGSNDGSGGIYGEAQVKTRKDTDGMVFGYLPENQEESDKLMKHLKFNEEEEETCRETARELAEKFDELKDKFPEGPQGIKVAGGDPSDGNFGGGGGGGGAGDMPGGPGGPGDMPEGPDGPGGPDDMPEGPDGPDDPGDPDYPDDPEGPDGPDDPEGPDGPDDPGDPDYPDDPGGPDDPNDPDYPDGPDGPDYPDGPDDPTVPGEDDPGDDYNTDQNPDRWDPSGPSDDADLDGDTDLSRVDGAGGSPVGGGPGTGVGGGGSGGGVSTAGGAGVAPAGLGTGGGAGGRGMGGFGMMPPMMGGGGAGAGGGGADGSRDTWLDEDEDVWGNGDDDAPPSVLGV